MQEELAKLVFKDELTDLYNRRFLFSYLRDTLKSCTPSAPVSLLMMDIDFFKKINDTCGHLEGDNVLKQLGGVIQSCIRKDEIAVRYAGDEFTVILPGQSRSDAAGFAEGLRAKVDNTAFKRRDTNAEPIKVAISIGIATAPEDGNQPDALIEEADKALYFSKRSGRNRISQAKSFSENAIVDRSLFNNFPCPVFIGRQQMMRELAEFIASLPDGHNSFVSLIGPSGIGKSRLMSELEKSSNNFLALRVICSETDKYMPYKAISNALKKAEIPLDFKSPQSATEEDRHKLFENITSRLLDLSKHRPLALLMDEFQNIDDGSLEVINFLNESPKGRVVIIASMREDIFNNLAVTASSLNDFLVDMSISPKFKEIVLSPLDEEQTGMMISSLLPNRPLLTDFDLKVYQTTSGAPLFVEELIKNFVLKKYIINKEGNWVINLDQIQDHDWQSDMDKVISENLGMMESDTRQVVTRATVVGREVDLSVLAGVTRQGEAETMDAIDKATRMRIIAPVDAGKPDQFTFVNQRVQEAVYRNIDDSERQTIHKEVGDVTERMYQDDPEKVAGILAFHYDKGGDTEKATRFVQLAENVAQRAFRPEEAQAYYERKHNIIRSRIKEGVHPLNSEQMNLMKEILRGLITAAKNMKLYPGGSQQIVTSTNALIKSMNGILDEVNVLTLSEAKNDLQINTTAVDQKAFGASAPEILALLKQHYIKSCTFQRGISSTEIESFLRNLDNAPNKPFSLAGYWNKWLEEKQITNIGITQRAFIAVKDRTSTSLAVPAQAKIEINEQNTPFFKDLLRYFCAAIENIRLYPVGSQLTIDAVSYVNKALANIFKFTSMINFSSVEDSLLINGTPVHPRTLGTATGTLARIIREYNLKSILIFQSVTQAELEKFLSLLSNISSERKVSVGEWAELLDRQAITNIKIGAISYSTADARRGTYKPQSAQAVPPPPAGIGSEPIMDMPGSAAAGPPKRAEDVTAKVNRFLKGMPERLISDEFIGLLDKLIDAKDLNNFNQLISRFFQNFKQAKPEIRTQSHSFYLQILNKVQPAVRQLVMDQGWSYILEGLSSEKDSKIYPLIAEAASRHSLLYLEQGEYNALDKVIAAIANRQKVKPEAGGLAEEMIAKNNEVFSNIKSSPAFQGVLNNFKSTDAEVRGLARQILVGLGTVVIPELVQFLRDIEEAGPREEAVNVIAGMGPEAQPLFLNELNLLAEGGNAIHLSRVLDAAPAILNQAPENVWNAFAEIVNNLLKREGTVREAAFDVIKKLDKDKALKICIPILSDKDKKLLLMALGTLAVLGYKEVTGPIISILKTSSDTDILQESCRALGKLNDEKAVPVLIEMLKQKRFLGIGLFGGVADEVRGSCAWALGNFKTAEAQDALKIALNDKSPSVRSAARLGLKDTE